MKIAVMQPYLFPYIGYFQLIMSSDIFVIYDDVNYITRGYINRNNILVNAQAHRFTVPVENASINVLIKDVTYQANVKKILSTIQQAYSKAEHFGKVFPIIEAILNYDKRDVPSLCLFSYQKIFEYLGIEKEIILSSGLEYDRTLPADKKLVAMCKQLNGTTYINSPGGRGLYNSGMFEPYEITLKFIEPQIEPYTQYGAKEFVPYLSILDVLMNLEYKQVLTLLNNFKVVK